jgi:phospholipase/carboxylesterase
MNDARALIVQQPAGSAGQLMLLFHGVGADADDLVPLGRHLAAAFPQAWVVSLDAAFPSDMNSGRQWFSIRGVTEENRPARVAEALPAFIGAVRDWQQRSGLGVEETALIGFSQGGIMALESARAGERLAGRIVALSSRFAALPEAAPEGVTLHLIHGKADSVIPYGHAVTAAERLVRLGADVTADVLPFIGHEINAEVASLLLERLQTYLPRRRWEEALRAAADSAPDSAPDRAPDRESGDERGRARGNGPAP